MALNIFVFFILIVSIFFVSGDVNSKKQTDIKKDVALLTFDNATMYTLTDTNISRIVYADKVLRYKNKDMMYNGKIILSTANKDVTDTILADVIVKKENKLTFINNASFSRSNNIRLESDEFFYDINTKIITNTIDFKGKYFNNKIKGNSIYFDSVKNNFKSKNVHFEIETKEN